MIDLLKYDPDKTFDKWDDINFEKFVYKTKISIVFFLILCELYIVIKIN